MSMNNERNSLIFAGLMEKPQKFELIFGSSWKKQTGSGFPKPG